MFFEELQALGVALVSLAEGIDATTPAGKLQMHIIGAIAEFEREPSESGSWPVWDVRRRQFIPRDKLNSKEAALGPSTDGPRPTRKAFSRDRIPHTSVGWARRASTRSIRCV
jgi:hypothetical protein